MADPQIFMAGIHVHARGLPCTAGSVVLHNLGNSLYNKGCKLKEAVTNEENTKAGHN